MTFKKKFFLQIVMAAGIMLFQQAGISVQADMRDDAFVHQFTYGDMAQELLTNPQQPVITERKPTGAVYAARAKGKWTVITSGGGKVLSDTYDKVQNPAKGVFVAQKNGKLGAYSDKGTQIYPCVYTKLSMINADRVFLADGEKEGIGDIQGNILLPVEYKKILWNNAGSMDNFIVSKDGKTFGFVDYNGKPMFSNTFKAVKAFSRDRAAVETDNNKWGYIDRSGQMVIPARYTEAMPFYDDVTLVKTDAGIQIIDLNGNKIADVKGSKIILPHYNGYGIVKNDGKMEYIDASGKILTAVSADQALPFINGSALIERKKSKVDLGAMLLGTIFSSSIGSAIIGGTYIGIPVTVVQDYKLGYINRQGEEYIPTKNDYNGPYYKDRVMTCIKGKYGYLGRIGEVIVPAAFDDISDFCGTNNDIVVVQKDDAYSYYRVGKGIFTKTYANASLFSDGMAAVDIGNDQWGYIDESGQTVIHPRFGEAGDFSEGVAAVKVAGKTGLIDHTGAYIVPLSKGYEDFGPCINGVLSFKQNGKWGLMDKTGKIIVPAQYDELIVC